MSWIRFLFTSGARLKRRVTLTLLAGIVCLVGLLSVAWAAALSTQDFAAINKLASSEPDAKTFLKAFEQAKNAINSDEEIPAEARTRLIAIISGDELTEDYKNDLKEAGLSDELLGQIEGLNKGAKAIQKELASASETVTAVRRETTASATARSEASATANNEPTQDEIFKFIEEKNPSLAAQVDAYMKGTVAKTDDGILTPSQMNEIPNNVLKLLKSNKDLEGVAQATVNQIISMHEAAIDSVRADAFANNTFNFESEKLNEVLGANPNLVQFLEQAAKGLLVENKAEGITGVSNFLRDYYAFNDAQLAKVTESLKTNVIDQNEVPVASSGKNIFKTLLKDNMEYVSFTPYSPKEREDVVAAVKKQVAESGNDTLTKQNLKDAMLALDSWRILDQQQFVEGEETRWDLTTIDLALASNVAIQQDYTRFWTGGDFTDKQITVLQNKLKHLYQSKMPRMTDEQYAALWKNLETKRSIFLQLKKDDAQAYSSLLSFVNGKNFTASEEDKLMTALKTAAVATQQAAGKIDGVEKATPNKAYARYLVAEVKTQRSVNMAWNPVQGVYSHPDLKDSDNHAALDTVEVKFFLNNLKKLSVAGQSFGANFFVNYKMPMPRVAQVARDARVQSGLVVFDKYLDKTLGFIKKNLAEMPAVKEGMLKFVLGQPVDERSLLEKLKPVAQMNYGWTDKDYEARVGHFRDLRLLSQNKESLTDFISKLSKDPWAQFLVSGATVHSTGKLNAQPEKGFVEMRTRYKTTIGKKYNLQRYPFDTQTFSITLVDQHNTDAFHQAMGLDKSSYNYKFNLKGDIKDTFNQKSFPAGWKLVKGGATVKTGYVEDRGNGREPSITFSYKMKRDNPRLFFTTFSTLYLAFILSFIAIALSNAPAFFAAKNSLILGSIFSLMANIQSTKALLSTSVSGLGLVDKLQFVTMGLLLVTICIIYTCNWFYTREKQPVARKIRLSMTALSLIVFSVANFLILS